MTPRRRAPSRRAAAPAAVRSPAASHDLRQPVQALQLLQETLSWSRLDEQQRRILDNARATSTYSSEMLNKLLDFLRLEAGVIEAQPRPFRLQSLLHKLEMELTTMADEKNLVYRTRDTEAVVASDPALLELILRNLIANAIRYTHDGGVLVACHRQGAGFTIEVYDTGIAPDQHRAIFREFHQLGNPWRASQPHRLLAGDEPVPSSPQRHLSYC